MRLVYAVLVTLCGNDRWDVKTLNDPGVRDAIGLTHQTSSVAALSQIAPPTHPPLERLTEETRAYSISVQIVAYKLEDDMDLHIVVRDLLHGDAPTMVVEFPYPPCAEGSPFIEQIKAARTALLGLLPRPPSRSLTRIGVEETPVLAQVTGVLFFDRLHGQTGAAANGVELHPVLKIEPIRTQ